MIKIEFTPLEKRYLVVEFRRTRNDRDDRPPMSHPSNGEKSHVTSTILLC